MKYLHDSKGCDPFSTNSHGCNSVMWCVQGAGGVDVCRYLLSLGCDFTLVNRNGHSSLHKAAQRGKEDVCRWLVNGEEIRGSITRQKHMGKDGEGFTPSALADVEGHSELASWLREVEENRAGNDEKKEKEEEEEGGVVS